MSIDLNGGRIFLGRRGENLARELRFDLSEFIALCGEGSAQLLHQRSGDETPYIVTAERAGNLLTWRPTAADTGKAGRGRAELRWYVGSVLAKSAVYDTVVKESMPEPGSTPAAVETALDALTATVAGLREDWQNATASAETLASGSQATVSFVDGAFAFGIPQGAKGDKGDTGDTGPQGPQGERGATGATGATGPQGFPGERGPKGDTGEQGPQGEKGDTGATGPQGPQGPAGPIDMGITGAVVGEYARVKTVDSNGKPTSWESGSMAHTITVTAVTQDGVIVTEQTVTLRQGGPDGPVYKTAVYNGQPVSFSVPEGFAYYISISSNLAHHFNPTTASGIVVDTDISIVLTYADFSTIRTGPDIKAALDAGLDLTDLVGESVTCMRGNQTLTWDVVNYDSVANSVTLLLHDTLPDQMVFEPAQALMYCENGLAAGSYTFKWNTTQVYFTLTTAIPEGGQLKANNSTFQTYESQSSTATLETGTVSTTEITGATDLGKTGTDNLNHHDRVSYGSNNFGESGLFQWLNSDAAANTQMPRICKFSRPYTVSFAGFMNGLDVDFINCLDNTVWKCSANNVYECPASLGGIAVKSNPYTVTAKFGLASEMEIFGSYGGVQDGSAQYDLFVGSSADDRKKYYNNTARHWWMRSPYWSNALHERHVVTSGAAGYSYASYSYGVVPACVISAST